VHAHVPRDLADRAIDRGERRIIPGYRIDYRANAPGIRWFVHRADRVYK